MGCFRRHVIFVGICLSLLVAACSRERIPPDELEEIADCEWQWTAQGWMDENRNGVWDEEEPPFPGVIFTVENKRGFVGEDYQIGNGQGEAEMSAYMPGCPPVELELHAQAPANYKNTTPNDIPVSHEAEPQVYEFGFAYRADLPPPTPRPVSLLDCTSRSVEGTQSVTDMALSLDGAMWATTGNNGVGRLSLVDLQRELYSTEDGLPDESAGSVAITPEGIVWIGTINGVARYDGLSWRSYTTEDGLAGAIVNDIAVAADGSIWFATQGGISRFDPTTNHWDEQAVSEDVITPDFWIEKMALAPYGSLWFLNHESIYQRSQPQNEGEEATWTVYKADYRDEFAGFTQLEPTIAFSGDFVWLAGWSADGPAIVRYDWVSGEKVVYNYQTTGGAMIGGRISSLATTLDGSLWIGLYDDGAMRFVPDETGDEGTWYHYATSNGLNFTQISVVVVEANDRVWFGTRDHGYVMQCVLP
jgi:streptogramin lyase